MAFDGFLRVSTSFFLRGEFNYQKHEVGVARAGRFHGERLPSKLNELNFELGLPYENQNDCWRYLL